MPPNFTANAGAGVSVRRGPRAALAACMLASTTSVLFAGAVIAGPYAAPAQNAAAWLEAQQNLTDGSWLDPSKPRTFLQTAEAAMALHLVNRRRAPYYAAQAWIENHEASNLDARARRLAVLRATQSSIKQDTDALLIAIGAPAEGQTGWGLAQRYRASPLDTAIVVEALRTAGVSFNSASTIAYLKATQLTASGEIGWPVAGGTTADPYTTAKVIYALAPYRASDATLSTPLTNAASTLRTKVTTTAPPHVRAAAALAYLRLDAGSSDARSLINSLVAQQRADGGFDAGVLATSLIVQAMAAAEGVDAASSRERVNIVDAALRRAINDALGRGALDQLNRGELAQLTTLDASNLGITNIEGLQYATNLTRLNLEGNRVSLLNPISQLSAEINCTGNPGCANTSLSLTYSPDTILVGRPVTFTATLSGGNTNGKLAFIDGATSLATDLPINASGVGTFTTSALSKGRHMITASYSGDYNHAPSTTTLDVDVRDLSWLPAVLELILE